jgi:hypothetical protein
MDPFVEIDVLAAQLRSTLRSVPPDQLADRVQQRLAAHEVHEALWLLSIADPASTEQLLPELLAVGMSAKYAGVVRQLMGRLARPWLDAHLSPLVVERLPENDDWDLRRTAELLHHLGLDATLRTLVEWALASADDDIREVGEDFQDPPA